MADRYTEWARRLRSSDAAAVDELIEELHAPLLRFAAHLTADADAAYDVLQDAFIKLWEVRQTIDPDRSLRAYVYRIVYRMALNRNRAKQRETRVIREAAQRATDPHSVAAPGEMIDAKLLGERIASWIEELPRGAAKPFASADSTA